VPAGESPYAHGASEIFERKALVRTIKAERRKLGQRLRELRLDLKWTQAYAAEVVGVHPVHVARVESGVANPTFAVIIAFAVAYKIPLAALFGEPLAGA
jgi:DNA-binding XRE family transcriptional regulator